MSVQNTPTAAGATQVPETTGGVYASLFEKLTFTRSTRLMISTPGRTASAWRTPLPMSA
ncbi:hypothetical protein [Cronobacter sakazakii]|uniref:hypothetical protein n=1 Tax=Cronobacter sakazakii TaxID=28141 RepID=UPI001F3CF9B7|nr:hypothetical protein [Cronobacter sakazakii]